MSNLFVNLPLPVLNGPGAPVNTAGMGSPKTVAVEGTFHGSTITIEVTVDGGAVWAPIAVFQTGDGQRQIDVAAKFMRTNVSGRNSALPFSADVDVGAQDAGAQFIAIPLPVNNGPGPAVNVATFGVASTFIAGGSFAGAVIRVEISEDNIAWAPLLSFAGQGGLRTHDVTAQFVRANVSGRVPTVAFTGSLAMGAVNDPITVASTVPPLLYTVFVGKNGDDAAADGSIGRPFLTVQAGMEFAWTTYVQPAEPQPVSPFIRPCVFVSAGTYDDGDLVLPPQICVMGEGRNHSRIVGNWSIDTRWANYSPPTLPSPPSVLVPSDMRSTWIGLGLFGDINFDFGLVVSNEGKLYSDDCRFAGNVTLTEKTVNPVSNQILFTSPEFLGNVTLNGIPGAFQGAIMRGGTLTFNQLIGASVDNTFETSGGSIGNIVVNSTSGVAPPYVLMLDHMVQPGATLTLNGAFSAIGGDLGSIPLQALVVLAGGANLNQVTRVNQLNWSGVTANRPPAPYVGQQYFDTTLGSEIWWNGVAWIGPGGPMSPPEQWGQDNVAALQAAAALTAKVSTLFNTVKMIRPGSVVGLGTRFNAPITAGTATVIITKNGVATTLLLVHTAGSNPSGGQATQSVGTTTYVAGDLLGMTITTDAGFLPVTTDMEAWMEVQE